MLTIRRKEKERIAAEKQAMLEKQQKAEADARAASQAEAQAKAQAEEDARKRAQAEADRAMAEKAQAEAQLQQAQAVPNCEAVGVRHHAPVQQAQIWDHIRSGTYSFE